jgi:hypothetical protein
LVLNDREDLSNQIQIFAYHFEINLPSCNGKISSNGPNICFNSESVRIFNVFIPLR